MFKKYRIKSRLSQEELAEKIGISWRQIQRIETYQCDPSVQTLGKLIKVLKISSKDTMEYLKKKGN